MRIVSGKFRHRKLLVNPGLTTRPITDRVKVSLFDRLQFLLPGARVADIFAGTGSMGLEAISRGAASAVMIERDSRAFDLLQQNVATLQLEEQTLCWRTDVFRTSFHPKGVPHFLPYDLVFFDPPYEMTPSIRPGSVLYRSLERLGGAGITAPGARLILRCERFGEFELPPCWEREEEIRINRMMLHFFIKAGAAADDPAAAADAANVADEDVENSDDAVAAPDDPLA